MSTGNVTAVRVQKRKAASVGFSLSDVHAKNGTTYDGPRMTAQFTILGPPQPWQRAGRTRKGIAYTPKETLQYERAIKTTAMTVHLHTDTWPKCSRYRLHIEAFFADRRRRDLDNVAKAVCDALNGVAYADDSQIDQLTVKRWVDTMHPRTVITIEVLP